MEQLIIKKNSKTREVMLNRTNEYYENNKKVSTEKAKRQYRELSEDEKNMEREYGRNRYHNMSEEKIQKLKEYQKMMVRLKNIFHRCKKAINSVI